MPFAKITSSALLLCALALTACAHKPKPLPEEPVLPVRPIMCDCPKMAAPPAELMTPPAVKKFLPET